MVYYTYQAVVEARSICNDFVEELKSKISTMNLIPRGNIDLNPAAINGTFFNLQKCIEEVVEENYQNNIGFFQKYSSSNSFAAVSYQARVEMTNCILPVYSKVIESLHTLAGTQ